jgi:hypothetical protein
MKFQVRHNPFLYVLKSFLTTCGAIRRGFTHSRGLSVCVGLDVFEQLLQSLISRWPRGSAIDGVAPVSEVIHDCHGF